MRAPLKLRSVTSENRSRNSANEVATLGLDHNQKIVSVQGQELLPAFGHADLIGKHLEQLEIICHLHTLLSKGFCFVSLPIPVAERWYLVDYRPPPHGSDLEAGLLQFRAYGQGDEAALVLHDFVQSIDPFSLEAGGGILLVDRSGTILMVNSDFAAILGLSADSLVGHHVNKVYPESTLSRLPKVMDTGKAEIGESHQLNGREIVASRWPLIKNGTTFGAYGKAQLRESLDLTRFAAEFPGGDGKSSRRSVRGHRPHALYTLDHIICHGQTMQSLKDRLKRVSSRESTVLLTGESGTGKELFAHALHAASDRNKGPFVRVNCAAIPETLIESELFGYVEGAFSGARRGGQVGKFEQAHGGTLFLDEISEMPLSVQAKLLRVMQEREVMPLGSQDVRFVDVRFVVATNCDAMSLVKDNKLRGDLYYRVNVVSIHIPPLRQRPEDIFYLTRHFIEQFNAQFNMNVQGLSSRAWTALKAYSFPGNVRELRSAVESAFNMVEGPFIRLYDLPSPLADDHDSDVPLLTVNAPLALEAAGQLGEKSLQEIMEEIEKDLIQRAMDRVGGNKLVAANLLGISRPGLYKKLQKYHMQ